MNTASLAEALERLGFDASLKPHISTFISLKLPSFTIHQKAVKEGDVIKFNLFFQKKNEAYSCLCYDAILRKEIIIADVIIEGIKLKELDERMHLIDWKELFHKEQNISSLVNDLHKLDSSKEGKVYSECLKVKYWSDTSLETIMNVSLLRSKYEISQRFYFMENGSGISVEEAYRFLNNKWMERQMRKKVVVNEEVKPVIKIKSKKTKSKS